MNPALRLGCRHALHKRGQREAQPRRERALAADLGDAHRMRVAAVDRLATRAERARPCPAPEAPAHSQRGLPLPIAVGIEVRAPDVVLAAVVLAPAQLRVEPLLGQRLPDQPRAQVYAVVAVGEALVARERDRREALGDRVLDARGEEAVGDRAVDRLLRRDEIGRGDELDARVRRRARSPADVADRARVPGDLHDARLRVDAGERRRLLAAPDADDAPRIAAPLALRIMRRLRGDAGMVEMGRIRVQHARAHACGVEAVGIARVVEAAERRRRLRTRRRSQRERHRHCERARHFVPQLLRRPRISEK